MQKIASLLFLFLCSMSINAQSLSAVESVEYDPINNRYLASSAGTSIVAIAPNGALSYFGTGLTADYGMEIVGNTLFAITGTRIKGYNLTSATQVMDLNITGASFLNGLGSDGSNRLWASDFNGYDIYQIDITNLSSPTYTMVADQNDLGQTNKPNGIVYDGANNRIVFVNWGPSNAPIKAMDLTTYAVTTIVAATGLGNIDGIDRDAAGNWYVASWSPARITRYSNDFSSSEIITVAGISSPADICYANETDTLAIPGGNQVLFVGFENPTVGIIGNSAPAALRVIYDAGLPQLKFTLPQSQTVAIDLFDMGGKLVHSAMNGIQSAGQHTLVLGAIGLPSGTYICQLQSESLKATERVVIP
jgi:hypothetical protein